MDPETLEAAISFTEWAIKSAEKHRDINFAIEDLKRIYCFLTDTDPAIMFSDNVVQN